MILRRSATQDGEDHQSLAEDPSLGGSSMRRCIRRCYESTPQANLTTPMHWEYRQAQWPGWREPTVHSADGCTLDTGGFEARPLW